MIKQVCIALMAMVLLMGVAIAESLPSAFDLRTAVPGGIMPVRDQGIYPTCSAHGPIAAVEAWLCLNQNLKVDLSEKNFDDWGVWVFTNRMAEVDDIFPTPYFSEVFGPVYESRDSYADYDYEGGTVIKGLLADCHIREMTRIPGCDGTDKLARNEDVKRAIQKNGAVVTAVCVWMDGFDRKFMYTDDFRQRYFRLDGAGGVNCCYYDEPGEMNHTVTLVGWDDNYSRLNFKSGKQPPGNGAWLVRDSLGASFADGGYFWLSYYSVVKDVPFWTCGAVVTAAESSYDTVYAPSEYSTERVSYAESEEFAARRPEFLTAVGMDKAGDVDYKISVYMRRNGTWERVAEQSGTSLGCGFTTVDLERPIPLATSDEFKIVVDDDNWTDSLYSVRAYTIKASDIKYTVWFNANEASTGTLPSVQKVKSGTVISVPGAGTLSKPGYVFTGWSTTPSGSGTSYTPGSLLSVTNDVTLFAQWREDVSVTLAEAQWQQPYTGCMDISCHVGGIVSDRHYQIGITAMDSSTGREYVFAQPTLSGLAEVGNGICRFVWDAGTDLGDSVTEHLQIKVWLSGCRPAVQLWENGPLWATCNIGAERPEDSGFYFWWGDTVGYEWKNNELTASDGSGRTFPFVEYATPTYGRSGAVLLSEGVIDSDGRLTPAYDAATAHWGCGWRMPGNNDFNDLCRNCTGSWTIQNGIAGWQFVGKGAFENRTLFLPAASGVFDSRLEYAGQIGTYWTCGAVGTGNNLIDSVEDFVFNSSEAWRSVTSPCFGNTVRAVRSTGADDSVCESAAITVALPKIRLSFDLNGGAGECSDLSRTMLMPCGTLPVPERAGYTFLGWWTDAEGGEQVTALSPAPKCDTVLFARWEPKCVWVYFVKNDGTLSRTDKECRVDSLLGELPVVEREGFTFEGWWTKSNGGRRILPTDIVPTESADYFAHWRENVTVGNVSVQTDGTGEFEISCRVDGIVSAKWYDFGLEVTDRATSEIRVIDSPTFVRVSPEREGSVMNGIYRLVWNASADCADMDLSRLSIKVLVHSGRKAVQLWEGGPYFANRNIGAESPMNFGAYFGWGNLSGYRCVPRSSGSSDYWWVSINAADYDFSSYPGSVAMANMTRDQLVDQGWMDENEILLPARDAAVAHWGENWRMPTVADFNCMLTNCSRSPTSVNGVYGLKISGRGAFAGRFIFLPAANRAGNSIIKESGSANYDVLYRVADYSWGFSGGSFRDGTSLGGVMIGQCSLSSGLPIRPVTDQPTDEFDSVYASEAVVPMQSEVSCAVTHCQNGIVRISCSVVGLATESDYRFAFAVSDTDSGRKFVVFNPTWETEDSDVIVTGDGTYTLDWNMADDLAGVNLDQAQIRVLLHSGNRKHRMTIDNREVVQLWDRGPWFATMNIGASTATGAGYYFWWGDVVGYVFSNSSWRSSDGRIKNFLFQSANVPSYGKSVEELEEDGWIQNGVLSSGCDAANQLWGERWRMPRQDEFEALLAKCAISKSSNGTFMISGKGLYADGIIYLRAAGFGSDEAAQIYSNNSVARYWTSTPSQGNPNTSVALSLSGSNNSGYVLLNHTRANGYQIRPVIEVNVFEGREEEFFDDSAQVYSGEAFGLMPTVVHTVAFTANGGAGSAPLAMSVTAGTTITLPDNPFTKPGYHFTGWETGSTIYSSGASYTVTGDTTFIAQWEKIEEPVSDGLAEALDNVDLVFTTGGDAEWFGQTDETHDRESAARSGKITHDQTTWMETTVEGPGEISFWWKTSSESAAYDYLSFSVDGVEQCRIGGPDVDWTWVPHLISPGLHTLRWTYCKDGSVDLGEDCGWVDQVWWTEMETVTITFDANGGVCEEDRVAAFVDTAYGFWDEDGWLPVPTRDGYAFDGWWTERDGGDRITEDDDVPAYDHTLYAHWRKPVTYYVSATQSDDSGDALGWATAKRTIQAAVDVALDGDIIIVGDGVYEPFEVIDQSELEIRSVNGATKTIVDGGDEAWCCACSDSRNVVLTGFTIRKGELGVVWMTVKNCVITDNHGCGGAENCVLEDCKVIGNTGRGTTGGLNNCFARRCVIAGNVAQPYEYERDGNIWYRFAAGGGAESSTLEDCVVEGNEATGDGYGGGMDDCHAIRCVIWRNHASTGGGATSSLLIDCEVINNTADSTGGGVSDCELVNCSVSLNTVTDENEYGCGGGLDSCTAYNCSIASNRVANGWGGGASSSTLYNCVVKGNTAMMLPVDEEEAIDASNVYQCEMNNCCVSPVPEDGEGNFDGDPKFLNMAAGALMPTAGSALLNRGSGEWLTIAVPDQTTGEDMELTIDHDLAGNPRVQGGAVDVGAYEGVTNSLVIKCEIDGNGCMTRPYEIVTVGGSATFTAIELGETFSGFLTNGVFATSESVFTWRDVRSDGVITAVFGKESVPDQPPLPTVGDGQGTVIVIAGDAVIEPTAGTTAIDVTVPDGFDGKIVVPPSVDVVRGVAAVGQVAVRFGETDLTSLLELSVGANGVIIGEVKESAREQVFSDAAVADIAAKLLDRSGDAEITTAVPGLYYTVEDGETLDLTQTAPSVQSDATGKVKLPRRLFPVSGFYRVRVSRHPLLPNTPRIKKRMR